MFYNQDRSVLGLRSAASNLVNSENPPYTATDFTMFYPQFANQLPEPVLTTFITMAQATVKQERWKSYWHEGMANFIGHHAIQWMERRTGNTTPTRAEVIGAGKAKGIQSSKSVGDVSVSYDVATSTKGLEGYADFMTTEYGRSYVDRLKPLTRGGMYVI
jgi:hypothetical protein